LTPQSTSLGARPSGSHTPENQDNDKKHMGVGERLRRSAERTIQ
jgi:hypothetical protein